MKKSLITLAVISAFSTPTWAQQETERLVVTANRTAQEQMDVLGSIIVVDQDDIELLQPRSLVDLLDRTAGITFTHQGGPAQSTSVFIRGTNSNHILVLVDGVRVGSATTGNKSIESINPSMIERIEIVKGPRAALYGSGAIGGVIHIFTRELQHGEVAATIELGSHQFSKAEVATGISVGDINNTISLSHESSDGINATNYAPTDFGYEPDNDGYERSGASLKGSTKLGIIGFNWIGLLEHGDYDYDGGWVNETSYKNYLLGAGTTLNLARGTIDLQLAQASDRSRNSKDGTERSIYHTKTQEVKLKVEQAISQEIRLMAGTDWLEEKVVAPQSLATKKRDLWGSYVSVSAELDAVLLDGSIRYDDIEKVGSEFTYNLSGGYQFTPDWLLGLNYGTGFKAPTFNDLYDPWGGNQDLIPETSSTSELFIKGSAKGARLEIALYKTSIDQMIEWQPIEPGSMIWKPDNVASAEIEGIDLTLEAEALGINWLMTATFLDTEDKETGKDLIRRPEQSFSYAGTYQYQDWEFSADINYNGHSFDSSDVRLSSYTLVNGFVSYQLNDHVSFKFYGRNLLDKSYQNVKDYNTPGREMGLVASFQL